MFRFKQFDVDQTGCAMKINTDGVLLGALAEADNPSSILDIGTGTGVIALMLAQRFISAEVDAVEIDSSAAKTAGRNFGNSQFSKRLGIFPVSFESFFDDNPGKKYDLIVSNPPFYINSLKSPIKSKEIAKHADKNFFELLVREASMHLTNNGVFMIILPLDTAEVVTELAQVCGLYGSGWLNIRSFAHSEPHRVILSLKKMQNNPEKAQFTIYKALNIYSEEYVKLLQPYFLNF
ncbi:MAG: tRNA1(Val) (adenine(37)-N6)-methyltransferase [Sphingobacteriales bacterium]